ncbi:hypothetical protein BLI708_01140 [Bifidobacterium imperatoris]|uniref:CTP synthase n=1 Tax=Bifidobacterium imperatoris TaxID=2020965 RepID=A0A2N5IS74_9BIFI|nr:hypothetical protein [Bifidobacterium imperatoris]PLS24815.1 hypothetical protein Tam1G_1143 [Bifidobacterium imperatoris]QSY57968.1 hypothetical protein BLI708_01140 [Bifidobacterium imperatoris]
MKTHKEVEKLLRTAEREQRCAIGDGGKLYHALRRRVQCGEVTSPYPNLFAAASYWTQLNLEQQSMHMIRALAKLHPKWIFTGLSAACVYQYDHAYTLHDGTVSIASTRGANKHDSKGLHRIYAPNNMKCYLYHGIPVTSPAHTLIDCATLPFDRALSIYDSALRCKHTTKIEVETLMLQSVCDEQAVKTLLRHANPLRENGGESWAYAHMMQLGYARPLFQVTFNNPDNPGAPYRVDFCWKLHDGQIIVVEYDGVAKYKDASHLDRASIKAKLEYERRRDRHLKEEGVTSVTHLFYEDVADLQRLDVVLSAAKVPKVR